MNYSRPPRRERINNKMGEKRKARGVCAHFTSGALMLWEMMSTLREKATTKEGVFLLAKRGKPAQEPLLRRSTPPFHAPDLKGVL